MRNQIEARLPAFASLVPAKPEFFAIDKVDPRLAAALGSSDGWQMMSGTENDETAFFLFTPDNTNPKIFVKVIPISRLESESAGDNVARLVNDNGVAARVMLPGFPIDLGDGRTVCGYPFINGNFAVPTIKEMTALGRGLARLHANLKKFGQSDEVRRLSKERTKIIHAGYKKLQAIRNHPARTWLEVNQHCGPDFTITELPCQVIHGDLNRANVLFSSYDGSPVFLDFEDARMSWLPVICDIAFVIERFALIVDHGGKTALRLATAFLDGYYNASDKYPIVRHGLLFEVLTMMAIRSLSILAFHKKGNATGLTRQEETKFIYLLELHAQSSDFFSTIENCYLDMAR